MERGVMARLPFISAVALALAFASPTLALTGSSPVAKDAAAITSVLTTSAEAWAKGDLDGFMRSYEESPRTTYIKGTEVVHGFAAVRALYAPRLTGPAANPGVLTVEVNEVEPLGPDYALTIGHFRLTRPAAAGGEAHGIFTLVFHKSAVGWRIVSDHTS